MNTHAITVVRAYAACDARNPHNGSALPRLIEAWADTPETAQAITTIYHQTRQSEEQRIRTAMEVSS